MIFDGNAWFRVIGERMRVAWRALKPSFQPQTCHISPIGGTCYPYSHIPLPHMVLWWYRPSEASGRRSERNDAVRKISGFQTSRLTVGPGLLPVQPTLPSPRLPRCVLPTLQGDTTHPEQMAPDRESGRGRHTPQLRRLPASGLPPKPGHF